MKRRQYLATAATALFAGLSGCVDPDAVLQMDEVTAEGIAARASREVTEPEARAIVSDAVSDGSATGSGRSPPLDTDRPVAFEGRYYDLTATETGRREVRQYEFRIDYDPETEPSERATVGYDDLPSVDRAALAPLFPPPEDPSGEGFDFGIGQEYSDEDADRSVLVPEQEYDAVEYEGARYPIRVGDSRTVTVSEYRYEADEIAADADAFADRIRAEHEFTLSGLSADERDIVETAVDDGYFEGETTDAFESLVERFRAHRAITADEWGGEWLVRYEGTVYWADLRHPPSAVDE